MLAGIIIVVVVFIVEIIFVIQEQRKSAEHDRLLGAIAKKLDIAPNEYKHNWNRRKRSNNMPKSKPQPPLTKGRFMRLLRKASQPVSEWQHDQEGTETSESHPSDDYNDTHRNQDKSEGKEG